MIISLDEAKQFLRISDGAEDVTLQTFIDAAEDYLLNATGNQFDSTYPLAKIFCFVLVSEWFENRQMIGKVTDRVRNTVESMLEQLTYNYSLPPTVV